MSICPSVYGVSWSGPEGILWFGPMVGVTAGPENIHYYVLHFHVSLKKKFLFVLIVMLRFYLITSQSH